MRCIFCEAESSSSKSEEHIVPESLGNKEHVLPPGVVCDSCNNYFATKVEQPLLESPAIRMLRLRQGIPNKRGRVPTVAGLLLPGFSVEVTSEVGLRGELVLDVPDVTARALLSRPNGTLILPDKSERPADAVMSRFLAKCAVEVLAQRLIQSTESSEHLVEHKDFQLIRMHARRGEPRFWPYSMRSIYDENTIVRDAGRVEQILHEYDLLLTSPDAVTSDRSVLSEAYFVLAIFGVEFVINIGGPEIEGYERWLIENNGRSPLYAGRNA